MNGYLLQHKDGFFLGQTSAPSSNWIRTNNPMLALDMDYSKATNIKNNVIQPRERPEWKIIENLYTDSECFSSENPPEIIVLFNYKELASSQKELYEKLKEQEEKLRKYLKICEGELIDLYHYIEFSNLDVNRGFKAFKMLQSCLKRRRKAKDELLKISYFFSANPKDFLEDTVLTKIEAMDRRTYTPRALPHLFIPDAGKNNPKSEAGTM